MKLRLQDFSEVTQPFMPTQDDAPRRREPDNEAAVHAASLVRGNEKNADTNETLSTLSEIYACVEAHNSSDCHDTQTQLNGSQAATKIDAAPLRALEAQKTPPLFSADMPLPRLHGMLCVRGSNLVLMGGIMELGSKEITLDDCWTLNLNKRCVIWVETHAELQHWTAFKAAIALSRSCPTDIFKPLLEEFDSQLVFRVNDKPLGFLKGSKYEVETECS